MMKYNSNGHIVFNDSFSMYLSKWTRVPVLLVLILGILVPYFIYSIRSNGSSGDNIEVQDKLRRLTLQLYTMKVNLANIVNQIRNFSSVTGNLKGLDPEILFMEIGHEPTEEYENLRRRVYTNTKELWYYIKSELSKIIKHNKIDQPMYLQTMMDEVSARKNSLLSDQEKMAEFDGHHKWRQKEAKEVSDLIQRRLYYLQNPSDCRKARKFFCPLDSKICGFGCQVHGVIVHCLIYAYATESTAILHSKDWLYESHGWDYVFYPLSKTCTLANGYQESELKLPQALPKDLVRRIVKFNGDPASWWVGQILKYALKPRDKLQKIINETINKLDFKRPIVGIHIRRTDKVGREASFHYIDEYMQHVRQYYDQLELTTKVEVRRVYLASDGANVLKVARRKYPDYVFLGNVSIARSAAGKRRYSPASLSGLLVDLYLLARTDYLVCTFSSNLCRLAYEMMQANRVDASNSFFSLDDVYYFGGQIPNNRRAVVPHPGGGDDITLEVNDLIRVAGNHWNGYGLGTNKKTEETGLFPWYKTVPHLVLYPFPEYKEVPLHVDSYQRELSLIGGCGNVTPDDVIRHL